MITRTLPVFAADAAAGAAPKVEGTPATNMGGDTPNEPNDGDKSLADDGSFLAGADAVPDDKTVVAPADWPTDWRERMAGEDKDALKRLQRMKSPNDIWKSYRSAESKITAGKVNPDEPMPDPEVDADGAKAWRQARGIPDDPTGYDLPETVKGKFSDADKPGLASFMDHMHKQNVPAQYLGPALEWYAGTVEQAAAERSEMDKATREETEEALRAEWGPEFRANATLAKRFAETITPGVNWFEARLADGRRLGDMAEFVKTIADLGSREFGDVAFAGGDTTAKTTARKEELERMMSENRESYMADPKLGQEYMKIMEAEEKRASRHR